MTEFTLKPNEIDTLKLNIGDESFQIPLATGFTFDEAAKIKTLDNTVEFFRRYIRAEVADKLTIGNWRDIAAVWMEASKGATGDLTPGE